MLWTQNEEKVYQWICLLRNTCAIRVHPLSWPQSHQPFESVAVALDNFLCQSPLQLQQNRGLPWVLGRTVRRMPFGSTPSHIPTTPTCHPGSPPHSCQSIPKLRNASPTSFFCILWTTNSLSFPLLLRAQKRIFILSQKKKNLIGMYLFFTSKVILNV